MSKRTVSASPSLLTRLERLPHRYIVPALLFVAAILAITSLVGDSITWDEIPTLTSGTSYLKTGDFRLQPEHPPLAKVWAALPMLVMDHDWPGTDTPGWRTGDYWAFGRSWLFELNDGERLVAAARCMMVILLLATCLCIYALGCALFGRTAGLLSLIVAVLSPSLLAHGRLVTTDLGATLCVVVSLLTFARLMGRMTASRLLAASASLAALSAVKFSGPLILPALIVMSIIAVVRRTPPESAGPRRAGKTKTAKAQILPPWARRRRRLVAIIGCWAFGGVAAWLAIWSSYGWSYSPFRGADRAQAMMYAYKDLNQPPPTTMDQAWDRVFYDSHGEPITGIVTDFARWARERRVLPEAYVYGLAYTQKVTRWRIAYLMGELSNSGWRSYFPIVFAVKTPVATMALLLALAWKRTTRINDPVLFAGLVCFGIVYFIYVVFSRTNIGHRHLLPIYPVVIVLAGASVGWLRFKAGRWLVGGLVVWLAIANVWIHPHYLSYFNELIGGPANGHRWLADSNIDWGQDLKRLARYARRHPDESIKLAYFGSADPTRYGFDCEMLPSSFPFGSPADLTPGTYVVSVTQLLGVYEILARDTLWRDPRTLVAYENLREQVSRPVPPNETPAERRTRLAAIQQYERLRRGWLLCQLGRREPDERIGYSLFVYRLDQADLNGLLQPPPKPH